MCFTLSSGPSDQHERLRVPRFVLRASVWVTMDPCVISINKTRDLAAADPQGVDLRAGTGLGSGTKVGAPWHWLALHRKTSQLLQTHHAWLGGTVASSLPARWACEEQGHQLVCCSCPKNLVKGLLMWAAHSTGAFRVALAP